jgi:tetratricopeptide (TPR) repeat protein
LAEKLCKVIEKSGNVKAEEVVGIKALHLDLRLDLAVQEPDLIKRKDLLKAILAEKEELIAQYSGRKEAEEAGNTLPDVYQKLGETITAAVQKEKNPELVAQLQGEGAKIYAQAEEKLKERRDLLAEDHEDPAKEDRYITTLYNLPRTQYFHSMLYPKDEFKKKLLLEEAIKGFQVLGLDFGDRLIAFEGLIYEGLCNKDLGQTKDAIACFDDAIKLRSLIYDQDSKGVYPMAGVEADIVSDAVLQKMLALFDLKEHQAAIDEAKTFIDTTPDPFDTRRGLAVLAQKAESHLALGDVKGASDCAEKLIEIDPRGPWGAKGRELQGKFLASGGAVDPEKTIKIAATYLERQEFERALQIAQQTIQAAKGHAKQADLTVDAFVMIGSINIQRGMNEMAAVAFDAAAERFPNATKAPECVYQALQCYVRLNKEDKRPYYKKRIEERQKTLISRYPTHDRAAGAQLVEASSLEEEKNWLGAAELYTKVQPNSPVYLEAQYKAGSAYFQQASSLIAAKKNAEAKPFADQAETLLKKSIADLDKKWGETMDLEIKSRVEGQGLGARYALAQLYLLTDRPVETLKLLERADEMYASNDKALSDIWGFRIKAYKEDGKIEEAIALLDGLAKKTPDSKAIGPAAGIIARELDTRAAALEKEKKHDETIAMKKRAAGYYAMSARAMLKSDSPRVRDIEEVGNRLVALGLDLNEVPETQTTSVGWMKPIKDAQLWQLSVDLFVKALDVSPNTKMQVSLGRTYGFLGKWDKAAETFAALFDQEPILDPADPKKFNRPLLREKKELLPAYFESGAAEHEVAVKDQDSDRFRRAGLIFDNLIRERMFADNSQEWWWAKYLQAKNQFDAGNYQAADILMRAIDRETQGYGKAFGLEPLFTKLKQELADKLLAPTPKSPPEPTKPKNPADPKGSK